MATSECSKDSESEILLTDVFEINRKLYSVTLTSTSITWQDKLQPKRCERVSLAELVAVAPAELVQQGCHRLLFTTKWNTKSVSQRNSTSTSNSSLNVDGFQLYFINRVWKFRWKLASLVFAHKDSNVINRWTNSIQSIIKSFTRRPQRLMVFINPFGGKKRAVQIYERKIQPLFNLAQIEAHVIITQRANHAKDLLLEMPLNKVDGVICVGGDGTFNEILNGLILRNQRDNGVDAHDPNANLLKPSLRIGIIPCGSTDAMSFVTNGINDPVTSALHIILGDSIGVDVSGVYSQNKLLLFCTTLLAYGYFGDILKASEEYRWIGPHRYDWAGFKQLLKLKSYEGDIRFKAHPKAQSTPRDGHRCTSGCELCASALQHIHEHENDRGSGWELLNGKFVGVNIATTSCACLRTSKGISPSAHIGDGYADLILVSKCSKVNYLRFLISVASPYLSPFNLDFVKVHRVREFHFKNGHFGNSYEYGECNNIPSANQSSVWNCDGEIISESNIGVRVHCQLVNMFARGIEDISKI